MKELSVYALAAAVLIVGVLGYAKDPVSVQVVSQEGKTQVVETTGAVSGPDYYNDLRVYGYLQTAGGVSTMSPVTSAYTITAADMNTANYLTFVASTTMPALTATLPASTTFPLGKDAGSVRSWVLENPFTAAATTTTVAAGTGIDLQEPDGQNVVIGINNYAVLTAVRQSNGDIVVLVDEVIPAD